MSSLLVAPQPPGDVPRVARLRYGKLGKIRFTSHRDVGRMWERALRRIALAVAYTGGFSPRPRISFGFALPTGAESVAEYVDVALDAEKEHDLADLAGRLSSALPEGIEVTGAALLESGVESLQAVVVSSTWEIALSRADADEFRSRLELLLDRDSFEIEVERKGRMVASDIRPGILDAELVDDRGTVVACELAARGTRPADFIRALGLEPLDARFLRTHQWIELEGRRAEPLAAGALLPSELLREEPTDYVRPQSFTVTGSPPTPAGIARGA